MSFEDQTSFPQILHTKNLKEVISSEKPLCIRLSHYISTHFTFECYKYQYFVNSQKYNSLNIWNKRFHIIKLFIVNATKVWCSIWSFHHLCCFFPYDITFHLKVLNVPYKKYEVLYCMRMCVFT